MFMQNVLLAQIWPEWNLSAGVVYSSTREGVWWVAGNPLLNPSTIQKNKKDLTPSPQKFFKTKKEIHMQTLKIISMIYTAWVLIRFVWLDCKSGDASESVIYKIFSLLQSVVLAYIIIK